MQLRSFIGVPDHVVIHDFEATDDDSHCTLARLLELLIVVMRRKLYRGQGYSTIHAYCVRGRHMAEFAAFKRVQAAKAASRHRVILSMVAEGRLHLTAILMLAPHLKGPDAEALLLEASHKTKAQLKRMLARIAPKPDVPTCFQTVAPTTSLPPLLEKLAPELVSDRSGTSTDSTGEEPISPPTLLVPIMSGPQARIEPRSPGRIAVQFMLDESEYEELQRAQALAPHEVMPSDVAAFYKWAVREVLKLQEKRRFAATAKPRASKDAPEGRHIPAHVKREVEGNATADSARSSATEACVAPTCGTSSSIIKRRSQEAVGRRLGTSGCSATLTISSRRSGRSAPASWKRSDDGPSYDEQHSHATYRLRRSLPCHPSFACSARRNGRSGFS